jgi:nitroimidazol reductase NimA-like FMN-containing flavoprotein (pyridoxamine 5'-phosphate oxidase superfamily)
VPKLSPEEIDELLSRDRAHCRLATLAADGWPSIVPLGFVCREQTIYLTARAKVRWLENLRRDPRVCVSIDDFDYARRKVTVKGRAEIRFEPGQDDQWRDLRLPLRSPAWDGPTVLPDGREEWNWNEAYTLMTRDEPRALVAIGLATATVTSWRMPYVGEYLDEAWARSYFREAPKRFKVSQLGDTPAEWRVIAE